MIINKWRRYEIMSPPLLDGEVVQHIEYVPFGEVFIEERNNTWNTPYLFNAKELDEETGLYYYGARYYNPRTSVWLSTDPLQEKYLNISTYAYCALNPMKYIDPTGMFINPIYDLSGNFLGTDDKGLQGFGFAMEIENFKQGMKHSEAMNYISAIPDKVQAKISAHVDGLKNRPDYDGFVTIEEGINWAKEHPYALENPTPDNSLYINTALLNFGNISSSQLNIGKPTPVNLFNVDNFAESLFNSTLRATIYALGRVNIMLESNVDETFRIINDSATDYDWNKGGGFIRDNFIKAERYRTGLDDRHGFKVFYYGLGKLNRQLF